MVQGAAAVGTVLITSLVANGGLLGAWVASRFVPVSHEDEVLRAVECCSVALEVRFELRLVLALHVLLAAIGIFWCCCRRGERVGQNDGASHDVTRGASEGPLRDLPAARPTASSVQSINELSEDDLAVYAPKRRR